MKLKTIIILLLTFQFSYTQKEVITGKVLGQELIGFAGVLVVSSDAKVLDTTDLNGNFKFVNSKKINKIKFVFPMTQKEEIELSDKCNHIEIILLEEWVYDFITIKQAERKKRRQRKRTLKKLYSEAYQQKLFNNESLCRTNHYN